jgi:AraC-like DNA-binding protein
MSERTLTRRFEGELGMSLRPFKAIELMGGGLDMASTGMEPGYGFTSAFLYAFRTEMGCSPQARMRGRGAARDALA